jgi:hypothetical protein
MKNLKEYLVEGLFDNVDKLEGKSGLESNAKQLKKEIVDWICSNYYSEPGQRKTYLLKKKFLEVDMTTVPPTVNCSCVKIYLDRTAVSLNNNGMFQWGNDNKFNLLLGSYHPAQLKSIEGLPEEFQGEITLLTCGGLKDLNGLPKKVGNLIIRGCDGLTSLKGCPEEVEGYMVCRNCGHLTSLEGSPKKVGTDMICESLRELKSLKGSPDHIGDTFSVINCKELSEKEIQWAEKKYGDKFSIKNEDGSRPMFGRWGRSV